jgi:hypothetical protein
MLHELLVVDRDGVDVALGASKKQLEVLEPLGIVDSFGRHDVVLKAEKLRAYWTVMELG